MKKAIFLLTVTMFFLMGSLAGANTITLDGSITGYGEGSVDYQYFSTDIADTIALQTYSTDFDTYIYLFEDDGDLDYSDLIASNDDYYGLNSYLERYLNAGSYIVAISDYAFSANEALSGMNWNNRIGDYLLTISAENATITSGATAPVPEPATMLLLGTGLVGLAVTSRKKYLRRK